MAYSSQVKRYISSLLTLLLLTFVAGCGSVSSNGGGGGGGTQPPPAPAGLQATAGNTQISLTWNTSTGATSYNLKRSTTNGGPYTTIASPTTASYTNTGLTNGTPYYFVVTAVNSGGESNPSSQATATPTTPVTIPPVPTGLQATAGNALVSLTWNASSGATSYNVKRSTTNGGPYTTIASPTTASYTNTGLTNGTHYYYVVTAVNSAGESNPSPQATATPVGTQPDVTITINPSSTHPISSTSTALISTPASRMRHSISPSIARVVIAGLPTTGKPTPLTPAATTSTKTTTTSAAAPRPPRPCAASSPATKPTAWPASSRSNSKASSPAMKMVP